jgi:photosystem II stability/assembly factor-like uncharacterized protein
MHMKNIVVLLLFVVFLASCKKESNSNIEVPKNDSSICFETVFINSHIQDGFFSVFFVNEKYGFLTGSNGGIYRTNDGAKTWTSLNSTTNLPIHDIYFLDNNNGFAVGGENSCGGTGCIPPGGFILRTVDGGQNWTQIFTPSNKYEITSITFTSKLVGFCVGVNVIYKTTDGGLSWTENKINYTGGNMMKIEFSDSQNGFVACLFDIILKTTNGGNSWEVTSPNKNEGYYSLSTFNGASYVSGQGKMLKSTDNGVNWIELPNSPSDIVAIHFTDKNVGYAFGRGNYSGGDFGYSYGSMYCTNNGGSSWNGNGDFKEVGSIESVSFPTANIGYAISGNEIIKISIK